MNSPTAQESLVKAIALVRSGKQLENSLPLLEHAMTDKRLTYAPMIFKFVTAILAGHDTTEVTFEDRRFRMCLETANLGLSIHHADGRLFEEAELRTVRALVPKRSVIVDVGANVGNHTVFFAGLLSPALVIPIEPVPNAVSTLRRNLSLNSLQVDERGLGVAAGRESGRLKVELNVMHDMVNARVEAIDPDDPRSSVPSVRLDDLIPERVDFLKIDVEGFESEVILGALRILREDKPLLMVEASNEKRDALVQQLAELSYKPISSFSGIGYQNIMLRIQAGSAERS